MPDAPRGPSGKGDRTPSCAPETEAGLEFRARSWRMLAYVQAKPSRETRAGRVWSARRRSCTVTRAGPGSSCRGSIRTARSVRRPTPTPRRSPRRASRPRRSGWCGAVTGRTRPRRRSPTTLCSSTCFPTGPRTRRRAAASSSRIRKFSTASRRADWPGRRQEPARPTRPEPTCSARAVRWPDHALR